MSSRLVHSSTILLRNLALHHVDTASLKLFPYILLFLFPLSLVSFHLRWIFSFIRGDGHSNLSLILLCDYDCSFIDRVEGIIQYVEIDSVFIDRLFKFNIDNLLSSFVLLHKSLNSFEQRYFIV